MQRYFLNESAEIGSTAVIDTKEDVHHIKNVMRQQPGDALIINFTNGTYQVTIDEMSDKVLVRVTEALELNTELPVHITIASGLLKNDKYEWMLQKATELGASQFMPFQGEFSVVKWDNKKADKKLERFRKIIKEAAEQSYRQQLPVIKFTNHLRELNGQFDHVIIAYEESAKNQEQRAFQQAIKNFNKGDRVLLVFGPEGGLSPKEIEMVDGITAGLGPRILRAETAPLYALSAISYHMELLG
ncbi:16S rRNA (uracil(1498)-N(3))-methyltransferase [Macrococcus brunensis]|uniref:16S rRNA (uracil(1498)-N(3))-methyltransferase n=1 Tax=Macrococcus brunensis TaxID=198483 RepID=UPI001EF144A1|nr:16S rRNA (uracil(1498)-N(3))-methyltransferase [Macrococcus brunensis]ULG71135.1 16S rRNA (uracil(1498)-N(3))-methyltransferase [Macrococcus brunensis]ULG73470.1 16S rRNA (uracil(1498)-N(3))-methyltransferase [Macrococcus brunensis]